MLNLQFSSETKPTAVQARQKDPLKIFAESLNQQMKLVKRLQEGKKLIQKKHRYVTGERIEVDVEVRPWFWQNDQGQFLLVPRYSSQPILIANNPSILCGPDLNSVTSVLDHLKQALEHRDETLTAAIMQARSKTQWSKS